MNSTCASQEGNPYCWGGLDTHLQIRISQLKSYTRAHILMRISLCKTGLKSAKIKANRTRKFRYMIVSGSSNTSYGVTSATEFSATTRRTAYRTQVQTGCITSVRRKATSKTCRNCPDCFYIVTGTLESISAAVSLLKRAVWITAW